MTVTIDIDLKAKDAFIKLAVLEKRFGQLDDRISSLGADLDLSIGDQIQELVDELGDLEAKIDNIQRGLGDIDDIDLNFDSAAAGSDGSGIIGGAAAGDGGGGMPPPNAIARRIEERFALQPGAIDADSLRGMEIGEIRGQVGRFIDQTRGTGFGNRGLMVANAPDELMPDSDGRFGDEDGPGSLSEQIGKDFSFFRMLRRDVGNVRDRSSLGDLLRGDADMSIAPSRKLAPSLNAEMDSDLVARFMKMRDVVEGTDGLFGKLGKSLRKLKPNMRKIYNLIALLLPLVVAFAAQALGVAAAFGAIATAGGAVLGLGLLGHANNMSDAFAEAKQQVKDFGKELFNVFQPAMQQFAPIQAEFFDWAPEQLTGVADALEGLAEYDDILFAAFEGMVGWIEQAVDGLVGARQEVGQLAMRFGAILGQNILGFFGWLLRMTSENQDMLIQLGHALKQIAIIVFNVAMVVGRLATVFAPVLDLVASFVELLNNRAVMAMLAFIATTLTIGYAVTKTAMTLYLFADALKWVMAFLSVMGSGSMLAGLMATFKTIAAHVVALIMDLTALNFTLASTLALLSALTLGGFAIAAGLAAAGSAWDSATPKGPGGQFGGSGGSPRGGGGSVVYNDNTYNFNTQGEMDTASEQRIRSTIQKVNSENQATNPPSPGSNRGGAQ